MVAYNVIGKPTPRVEGADKVTGRALYTSDLNPPGTLWAKVLHGPYAHARILRIDTSAAEALPGVHAVITGADVGDGLFGTSLRDLPVLARDRVRFVGERVAAVAADDADIAQRALDLIDVEYEELPAVFDPIESMSPDAPVIHPDFNTYPGVSDGPGEGPFGPITPLTTPSNIYKVQSKDRGDIDAGFAEADVIVERTYFTQRAHQGYLEPTNCLVSIDPMGKIDVWAGTKMPYGTRNALSEAIHVEPPHIVVNHTYIGGDFGGKATPIILPICYFLAKRTGRPVRLVNDYINEFLAGNPRHSTVVRLRTGVKRDGRLTAHHVQFYVNCGAYAAFKPGGTIFGPDQAAGPYVIANTRIESAHVYTNTVPGGYVRAPGEAQGVFALESHLDEVAREIGIDPIELRLRNLVEEGDDAAFGMHFEQVRAKETLRAAAEASHYNDPKPQYVGRGAAMGERPGGGGVGNAEVTLHPDGNIVVGTPIFDQGTGTYTTLCQVVAEELGVPLDRVSLEVWSTEAGLPFDSGIAGSWGTRLNSSAAYQAAQDVKKELLHFAAEQLGWPEEKISLRGDEIWHSDIEERVSWPGLLEQTGHSVSARARFMAGFGQPPHITSFNAQIAEVAVDPETGEVRLLAFTSVHDVGRILNPTGHQGQINGGIVQGIGYALMEELRVEDGRVTSLSFGDYKLPTTRDLPPLNTVLLPSEDGHGPYNLKAIGEVPISPVAPAIANAIADAIGVRVYDLPLTAEKVYQALKANRTT